MTVLNRRVPVGFILQDRADGRLWHINDFAEITDAAPIGLREVTSDEYIASTLYIIDTGLVVEKDPAVRLIVRDGYLGYELREDEAIVGPGEEEIISTKDGDRVKPAHKIVVPSGWTPGDVLASVQVT